MNDMGTQNDRSTATQYAQQVPFWLLDLLLGVAVSLIISLVISADQGGGQDPDLIAYLFACGFGALMLVRRRFPVAVLVATMFLLFNYYVLDYPAIGLAVPVSAALYSGAELGHLTSTLIVSLLLIGVSTYVRILDGQAIAYLLGYELVSTVTLMAAAIALGDNTRSRRSLKAEQEQTARLIEQEHALRTEQRLQAERVRMARELHDVIGHSISVISLHADIAKEALGHNDDEARRALTQIRATTSATMRELRSTVKQLRNPAIEQPDRSVSSLTNLANLIDHAQASGLLVALESQGDVSKLPAALDTAAYRIVQESVTNVMRHANATQVVITISVVAPTLQLKIVDNGLAATHAVIPGNGIVGMQERARLLGGTLTAQPRPTGGFAVSAIIPLERRE